MSGTERKLVMIETRPFHAFIDRYRQGHTQLSDLATRNSDLDLSVGVPRATTRFDVGEAS